MQQPPGFVAKGGCSKVCYCRKSLYGLKQSPQAWFEKFNTTLLDFGFKRSASDYSVFIKKTSKVYVVLIVYVDDIAFR